MLSGTRVYRLTASTAFVAATPGALIFASTLTALADALAVSPSASLAANTAFRTAISQMPANAFGQFYVDAGQVLTETRTSGIAGSLGGPIPSALPALKSVGIPNEQIAGVIAASATQLRLQGIVIGATPSSMIDYHPRLLTHVPADVVAVVSFDDLAGPIANDTSSTQGSGAIGAAGSLQQIQSLSTKVQAELGVSTADLATLFSGEHALVVTGGRSPGAALMLEVSDGGRASSTLDTIRQHLPLLMQTLALHGIRVPPTYFGRGGSGLTRMVRMVGGFPVAIRLVRSLETTGVIICEGAQSMEAVAQAVVFMGHDILVQRYIEPGGGRDLRALVLGGKVIAAVRRQPPAGLLRHSLSTGARVTKVRLTEAQTVTAVEAARVVGLRFAAVDMLCLRSGETQVFEVHSSPGLREMEAATGQDLARAIVLELFKQHEVELDFDTLLDRRLLDLQTRDSVALQMHRLGVDMYHHVLTLRSVAAVTHHRLRCDMASQLRFRNLNPDIAFQVKNCKSAIRENFRRPA